MIEPTIFLGPPGCGKTTALLDVVDMEMSNGVPPDRIGFMTFTRRGVNEAVIRASEKFVLPRKDFKFFNTLHSAAFRHLNMSRNQVFTGKQVQAFGKECGCDLMTAQSSEDGTFSSFHGDNIVIFLDNYARITGSGVSEILKLYDYAVPDSARALKIINLMNEFKHDHELLDFTDMIQLFIKKDDPPKLEVLIIDEAQDLSNLQWQMVDLLSRHVKRMYIAGDDDQTIFGWAGASEKFITLPGNVKLLSQSYRVPIVVHDLANRLISNVMNRREKEWNPRNADGALGDVYDVDALDPSEFQNSDTMMLGRTIKSLRKYERFCKENGILYRRFDNNSIKPAVASAIKSWIELQQGKAISVDKAIKIYDLLPSESHGDRKGVAHGYKVRLNRLSQQIEPIQLTVAELRKDYGLLAEGDWNYAFTEIDIRDARYIQRVMDNGHDLSEIPKIHISTIHRVKGGQANKVVLLSEMANPTDKFASNRDEEFRVFYTGITRTYEDLTIVQSSNRHRMDELFQ